jgi:hypothetical protein
VNFKEKGNLEDLGLDSKTAFKEVECKGVAWVCLAEDRGKFWIIS